MRVLGPVLKALGMSFSPSDGEENTQHSPQGLGWHRARDRGPLQPFVGGDEGGDLASAPPAGVRPVLPVSECHRDACLAAVRSVLCSSELF